MLQAPARPINNFGNLKKFKFFQISLGQWKKITSYFSCGAVALVPKKYMLVLSGASGAKFCYGLATVSVRSRMQSHSCWFRMSKLQQETRDKSSFIQDPARNGPRTDGTVSQEHRNPGPPEHRNIETPEHRNTGTHEHGSTGTTRLRTLERRNTWTLEHRNIGTQEYRNTQETATCIAYSFGTIYSEPATVSSPSCSHMHSGKSKHSWLTKSMPACKSDPIIVKLPEVDVLTFVVHISANSKCSHCILPLK